MNLNHITVNGKYIAIAHALFASSAFLAALVIGCFLHYTKIVQNASFGYPDEWFPSVSATIGDRYPERSVFQILIAVTSGPRFLLIFLNFLSSFYSQGNVTWANILTTGSGLIRTFTCGGWVYITSTDDHDWHDIFMIAYIVLTIPWHVGISVLTPKSVIKSGRIITSVAFFSTLVPLVYWFIQHKVHIRPGAYSIYAYFEWALILLDIGFDTWSIWDFEKLVIVINHSGLQVEHTTEVKKNKLAKETPPKLIDDDFSLFQFIIHCVNSFILWTIFTSLFLCVWHFPLWYMGISGYEAVIISLFLGPLLLLFPYIKPLLSKYPQISRVIAVLFGIGAYKFHEPEKKLISVSIGTFFGSLSLSNELSSLSGDPTKFNSYTISFIIGLLASSIIKFMFYTNNPFWPVMNKFNGGHNEIGIFLGLCGALFTSLSVSSKKKPIAKGSFILASLGFGGLFFLYFAYLTDTSTLILWTWSGYPITGPTPISGALFNIITIMLGILASLKLHSSFFTSLGYNLIFGGGSCLIVYLFPDWLGYFGGLGLTFWLITITPIIFQNTIGFNPGLLFAFGLFWVIALGLAGVWTVAYAFVPGGFLLRERSDIVLGLSYLFTLCGIINYRLTLNHAKVTKVNYISKTIVGKSLFILTVLLSLSVSILYNRTSDNDKIPFNESSQSFTTGIWCIHFGLDNDMWSSHDRMRDLIKDAEIDIIGLLETDTERLIGGNRDFTEKIAHDLGMYVDYGPGPNKHTWGCALLSKFPILKSSHHLLPSPVGELAPAILATLDIYGTNVDVVVFHSGQEEDEEDRRLQSLALQSIMGESSNPLVLLSYLVTNPLEGNYLTYASDKSRMHDIDSTDWDRWCEYIMFRELKKVAYARISRSTITDTELQIAKFKLLSQELDDDFLYGNHFIDESQVPENLRLPDLFKGDGVRGHRYHVFDEPRYFALSKEDITK